MLGLLLPATCGGRELPTPAEPAARPLRSDPAALDLGEVKSGQILELAFVLTNRTAEPVRLRYMFTECDCTLTVPDSATVPGGGAYTLRAELNLLDREPGPVRELITILTDLPAQPELLIPVHAEVMPVAQREQPLGAHAAHQPGRLIARGWTFLPFGAIFRQE